MKEIWKPIKDYEGLYEISNFGRVKSCAKEWVSGMGTIKRKDETILKQSFNDCGYLHISVCKDGKQKTLRIASLVWDNFGIGKRNGWKLQIDHIDADKTNNKITNLQLLTARNNVSKQKKQSNKKSSSKYIGVCKTKEGKYSSHIGIKGKHLYLGCYDSEKKASDVYYLALKQYLANGRIQITLPRELNKTSKYKGVCWTKNRWQVCYRNKYIGRFKIEYEAHLAYQEALNKLSTRGV